MQILLATRNKAKFREMKEILESSLDCELLHPDAIDPAYEVIEDGKTFEENAIKKAREWGQKSGMNTIADDGGFEIDALNGEPGVLSRRWPGYEADDETLIRMVLERLEGIQEEGRTARLRTVVALYDPKRDAVHTVEAVFLGVVTREVCVTRESGYPFRSILWVPFLNKYYIEMTPEEHAVHNHRMKAMRQIVDYLETLQVGRN